MLASNHELIKHILDEINFILQRHIQKVKSKLPLTRFFPEH